MQIKGKNVSALEKYIYIDCRKILLHIIGKDYNSFSYKHGFNTVSVKNFISYNFEDFCKLEIKDNSGKFRYLTVINCIRILELSGYEIKLSLVLKNDGENEV